jgi:hypothetical protein
LISLGGWLFNGQADYLYAVSDGAEVVRSLTG